MDLQKLIDMQRTLDNRIIDLKGLQGKDLVPHRFVALQVELSEFANEGRWFKYWSEDQKPRLYKEVRPVKTEVVDGIRKIVDEGELSKPLLEEFVDAIHFFLSIAIQMNWEKALFIYEEQLDPDEFDGDLTAWYLEMTYFLNKSYFENPEKHDSDIWKKHYGFPMKQYWFRVAWVMFLNIGINGFGLTLEEIEQAYFDKNKVNHERQMNGY